ncbi:beta-galactosidase [Dysgonomonas hofstadii]|uniref:Beta-galactosidase n=1 Tax=Dysgonomonas hofstadii TaxID=637886 RepID=A0A840CE89_9BACT|nr:glycoside hydrolase family 2 TIM barrel-domain containing protein [Dysgonomonas hofstadii]MBB4034297.1 beta-galactosidase [Dysgonomonas hofstadii]
MNLRQKYHKLFILILTAQFCCLAMYAQHQMQSFNNNWHFIKKDIDQNKSFNKDEWQKISIPHTWNTDAYIQKDYYRGIAWYHKTFTLSDRDKERQIYLRFEGVNQVASVYINGQLAGEHKGGYTSFTFNITTYCTFDKENTITVKVDNSITDVPPISGDFTIFGGIYRDIWLITTPDQHIDLSDSGSDGIFIHTDNVSEKSAFYSIRSSIANDSRKKAKIKIIHTVRDPHRNIIKTLEKKLLLEAHQKKEIQQDAAINNPLLWSPETPYLYTVETTISDEISGEILDEVTSPLGFRWFRFDGEKGFFLNGKPYKLNGICRHQDQMPIGNALSDEAHRRDMQLIKEMGANFVRISHYPQDKAIIEQCDKLGLLVWEEIPIIDIIPEETSFGDNCETNLREMIRQHYNHPSVIMWGYMNEILLVTQRKHKGKELDELISREIDLAKRLEKVLKEEDSRRYSVMAFHGSDSYNKAGFGNIVDIVGWNLYQGWYSDNMQQFDQFIENQQKQHPGKPKIISEYGAGSDKRIHSLKPKRFDFSIEYQQEYAEHYLSVIARKPYICGATYWNFIDFGSAQRDESMPRINNKGLVYADRTPKDVYYLFKASYRKDIPVLHIASHDWKNRTDVSIDGGPVIQPLKIYSNLPEVELFMNGISLGKKKIKNHKAIWDIPFTDGEHHFSAKGEYNGHTIETGIEITFTAIPDKLTNENFYNKELAINCGSDAFYTSPESNLTWLPDREYTNGSWGYVGGEVQSTQAQITGTDENPLFQTLRTSSKMYRFDVPKGEYEIELLFADIFHSGTSIAHALGSDTQNNNSDNIFDVIINTMTVDPAINLNNTVGNFHGIRKKYIVKIQCEKSISVEIKARSGKAFINGIKLRKL